MRNPLETRVDTPQAQGDGSYVVVRRLTRGERREQRARFMELATDDKAHTDAIYQFIFDHLVSWNWTDEEGKPLPLPKCIDDIDDYTPDEVNALEVITGQIMRGDILYKAADEKK